MKNCELFKNVSEKTYINNVKISKFKANSLLFSEGEICDKIGIILNGEVKISTLTYENNEYIIQMLSKNDIFGDALIFSNDNKYLGDGIAVTDCEIIYLDKKRLFKLMTSEIFLENYLKIISNKISKMSNRVKLLSQKSIEDRIMFYLISESKKNKTNIISISGKESLARILNIPRPSLSRELINLQNKGIIEYDKYYIKIKKTH